MSYLNVYLGDFLNLHQTHATVSSDRQSFVVAEARNLDSHLLASLEQNEVVEVSETFSLYTWSTPSQHRVHIYLELLFHLLYLQHGGSRLHRDRRPVHKHLQQVTGRCCCCCCCSCSASFKHKTFLRSHVGGGGNAFL